MSRYINYSFLGAVFIALFSLSVFAQSQNMRPKLNQLGFYPDGPKIAVTPAQNVNSFHLRDVSDGTIVFEGNLQNAGNYSLTGENIKIADFTQFKVPGTYQLYVDGTPASFPFDIENQILDTLHTGITKALYFNRVSVPLEAEYAGVWARPAGHPDDEVIIHASAASEGRPGGSTISSPGGWYDAGDYNKYVVPISSSISHMLFTFEQFPDFFEGRTLNIPESGNSIPDILDESMFALEWLLTMQDPGDGGVYHKLTHANFQGTIMPSAANANRYVVQKSTTAALDFAAVMAQASRVYRPFFPEFADTAISAAKKAYEWAEANPNMGYNQDAMNQSYDPDVSTGGYGDSNFGDEFFWAATEIYITTKDDAYYQSGGWNNTGNSGWGDVRALGLFSLLHHRQNLTNVAFSDTSSMKSTLLNNFEWYANDGLTSPYRSPFGVADWQFGWGSNGGAGNLGMAMMMLYQTTGNQKFYNAALHIMDYLMGRNGVGYSFVTGFGDQTPMHIHHRQSQADTIEEPVPGWVAGGANPGNQSQDCGTDAYSSSLPALSFADRYCSYSTNEITTYWNSPFIYVTAALEYFTEDVEFTPGNFIKMENPMLSIESDYFEAGDTLDLHWTSEGVTAVDISYKAFNATAFTEIATGVDASSQSFENFIVPSLPGDSLVIKITDANDENTRFNMALIKIKPSKSVRITNVTTWFPGFDPGNRVSVEWTSFEVDSVDLTYRLSSADTLYPIQLKLPGTQTQYFNFKVPNAEGDTLWFRVADSHNPEIYGESDPFLIPKSTSAEEESELVTDYNLHQNYPNPFNPTTQISFDLPVSGKVSLKVFDAVGREISVLVNGIKEAGQHQVTFNASGLPSGVYFYLLESGGQTFSRKMTLIK